MLDLFGGGAAKFWDIHSWELRKIPQKTVGHIEGLA